MPDGVALIPVGRMLLPWECADRERQLAEFLCIDETQVHQPRFGGPPVVLYPSNLAEYPTRQAVFRTAWPELDCLNAWHPLLWLTREQATRFPDESDDAFALRIIIECEQRGMYNADTGLWFGVHGVWQHLSGMTTLEFAERVRAWHDGGDDNDLERHTGLDVIPPDAAGVVTPFDWAYQLAQEQIADLMVDVEESTLDWATEVFDNAPPDGDDEELLGRIVQAREALHDVDPAWDHWFDPHLAGLDAAAGTPMFAEELRAVWSAVAAKLDSDDTLSEQR